MRDNCDRHWTRRLLALSFVVPMLSGCDAVSGLFQPSLTIVVENGTGFTAVRDIRTSNSRNIIEDVFSDSDALSDSGTIEMVAPNQTMTVRLKCDGDLELITFEGARFRDTSGFSFGDADADKAWRRDVDFDCGDTIQIRLSGTVFFFDASTTINRTGSGGASGAVGLTEDDDQDIGTLIDRLLGS